MTLHVVTGPPAAGKSTFVREHAQPGDIRIDFDELANTFAGLAPDNHQHGGAVTAVARAARDAAIEAALKHTDTVDVWLIHSTPSPATLSRYHGHGAEIHVVDPGRDTVMRRIKTMRPGQMHAVAARWYEKNNRPAPGPRGGSTTERGLGWRHQQQRERLLRMHRDGTPCWWCGEPMYRSQALDADHGVARANGGTLADRLLHSKCNRSRKSGTRDDERPAVSRQAGPPAPAPVFDWGG